MTSSYEYQGISVSRFGSRIDLVNRISELAPDLLCYHFIEGWMIDGIVRKFNMPQVVWVHGTEALGWYRRLFNIDSLGLVGFVKYAIVNCIQLMHFNQLVRYSNCNRSVKLVFVSNWMRRVAEVDSFSKSLNFETIPNPIDDLLFSYNEKIESDRKKILLLRSFDSKKYATDIAIEAILLLAKRPFFNDLSFTICGKGKFFDSQTRLLGGMRNVKIVNSFFDNNDIPAIHKEHGIFLCPTRQDAQGVSMCEAMSSGLVPITSDNTAIPEFVDDGISGFLTKSSHQISDRIEDLYYRPEFFLEMSRAASRKVRKNCSSENVIKRELSLLSSLVNDWPR